MRTQVVVAVRSHFERHGWIHPELMMWLVTLGTEQTYQPIIRSVYGALNAPSGANFAAMCFLKDHPDAEWLCILDNDVVPPSNILRILDNAPDSADMVAPMSHMCQQGVIRPQAGFGGGEEPFVPIDPTKGPQFVDRLGGCCWFIRRRVFDKLELPYFAELCDPKTLALVMSDDIYFQRTAMLKGYRQWCNPGFVVTHYHSLDLSTIIDKASIAPAAARLDTFVDLAQIFCPPYSTTTTAPDKG